MSPGLPFALPTSLPAGLIPSSTDGEATAVDTLGPYAATASAAALMLAAAGDALGPYTATATDQPGGAASAPHGAGMLMLGVLVAGSSGTSVSLATASDALGPYAATATDRYAG